MPIFDSITYTMHVLERMRERSTSRIDAETDLQLGEGMPGEPETWMYEYGPIRVVVVEKDPSARIITVMRLQGM